MEQALALKRFKDFVRGLSKEDVVGIVHHCDADGLASAVAAAKAVEKLTGKKPVIVLSQGYSDKQSLEKVIPALKQAKANKVIVLDLGIDQNPVLSDGCKEFAQQILVLDHHKLYNDLNDEKVVFLKAQFVSELDGSRYPCAKLTFDLFSEFVDLNEINWVVSVGILGDMGLSQWREFVNESCVQHSSSLEQLMQLKNLVTAVEGIDQSKFPQLFEEFYSSHKPADLMDSNLFDLMKQLDKEVNTWFDSVEEKAEFFPELELVWLEVQSAFEIKSALINRLSSKLYSMQTVIVVQDQGKEILKFSARRQDFKVEMNNLLEKAVEGLQGARAGGHIPAAAGQVKRKDLQKFKEKILEILKEKYRRKFS